MSRLQHWNDAEAEGVDLQDLPDMLSVLPRSLLLQLRLGRQVPMRLVRHARQAGGLRQRHHAGERQGCASY